MKFKTFLLLGATTVAAMLFGSTAHASDYTVNNEFNLSPYEGAGYAASNNYIILHETANATATGRNEATYMKNNWFNAYTTDIIGDGGIDYRVGQWGMVSWGAGNANPYAPVQIELQHTTDPVLFKKNYKAYIALARNAANHFGIPLDLDGAGNGIKSHKWVSDNIWGDHQDPYGYLASMGISKAQLAHDLKNGVSGDVNTDPTPTPKPQPPKPENPTKTNRFNYRVDGLEYVNGMWQIYNEHLGKVDFNWTDNGIPVEVVDKVNPATGQPTSDQVLHVGDYFNFQVNSTGVVQEQTPFAGYTLSHVQLPNEFIWLFTENRDTLLYQ